MATARKIGEIIAAIKTVYPYYSKDADVKTLARTWQLLLSDVPDDVAEVAFTKCLKTCKMPPTPADVLEKVEAMTRANKPTAEELWSLLLGELRKAYNQSCRFNYNFIDSNGKTQGTNAREEFGRIWEGLPENVRTYIGSANEFRRMAQYGDEELRYEKSRFLKTLPTIEERRTYSELSNLIESHKELSLPI